MLYFLIFEEMMTIKELKCKQSACFENNTSDKLQSEVGDLDTHAKTDCW